MNNETAIIVGLVLAVVLIASLYAATEGTLELAGEELNRQSEEAGGVPLVETDLTRRPVPEVEVNLWRREQVRF